MRTATVVVLALMAGGLVATAQTNPPATGHELGGDARSAGSNVPGQQYPKIDSERHAEFRLRAPGAARVQLDIGGHKYDLTTNSQGVWSVVTPPLVVGFHYYAFVVDGLSVADPASESFFGVSKMMSGIEVPSRARIFMMPKTCLTAKCANTGIIRGRTTRGAGASSTRRRITRAAQPPVIPLFISSMAPVKTNAAGRRRAA